ncbi:longitudinals lacking protein, isoforms H/M/V-like isoform X2 [Ornithodoros turicata]|uniref:longitudinals lacking protein, isoforms H/M/V-like isoform X2 n=1 Tax=Ornithodoros turicata TaxID=34597 RepID=UPI0031389AE7
MGSQQFCLKWKSHYNNLLSALDQLLFSESFTDVTLACEGLTLKAHKAVLSACSPFFQGLFVENKCQHPIVILKDFKYAELRAIVDFMYHGEVNVSREHLSSLLKAAEALQVKGLTDLTGDTPELSEEMQSVDVPCIPTESSSTGSKRSAKSPPTSKRKRVKPRHVSPRGARSDQGNAHSSADEQTCDQDGENSNGTDVAVSPLHLNSVSVGSPSATFTTGSNLNKSKPRSSVLETLLSAKDFKAQDMEAEFEPSKLIEQALAAESPQDPAAGILNEESHQKLFPASSQLSLLATAKMLESQSTTADGDSSAPVLPSFTDSPSNSTSNQGTQPLFPARGGRNSGWTEDQMQKALNAVFSEGVPMTTAARSALEWVPFLFSGHCYCNIWHSSVEAAVQVPFVSSLLTFTADCETCQLMHVQQSKQRNILPVALFYILVTRCCSKCMTTCQAILNVGHMQVPANFFCFVPVLIVVYRT